MAKQILGRDIKVKMKVFALPLLLALTLVLAACGSKGGETTPPPAENGGTSEPAPTDGGDAAPAPDAEATPAPADAPPAADAQDIVRPGNEVPASAPAGDKVVVNLETKEVTGFISADNTYKFWTYGGKVPGPFIRTRLGQTIEFHLKNDKSSTFPHSIDLHAVSGPGGGGKVSQTNPGEETVFTWKNLNPGLYVYHCATPDIPTHVTNGMYGLILVEPAGGLPKVDKEFYVMQGDFYAKGPKKGHLEFDAEAMDNEEPRFVVMNGKALGLTGDKAMQAKVGDKVRIYFGVGGANLASNFHVIGEIFDVVHPEGTTDGLKNVQTTIVPPGGSTWVEFKIDVPGDYILVDHSLSRALHKGAVAIIHAEGADNAAIFSKVK